MVHAKPSANLVSDSHFECARACVRVGQASKQITSSMVIATVANKQVQIIASSVPLLLLLLFVHIFEAEMNCMWVCVCVCLACNTVHI